MYDDHADWIQVKGTERVIETGRWSIYYSAVFRHVPTNKHYELSWSVGATEHQEESPFEYDDPTPIEVELKEVTKKEWVAV